MPGASEAGRFSLALPIPFNDFTLLFKAKAGEPVAAYIVGGKSSEGEDHRDLHIQPEAAGR